MSRVSGIPSFIASVQAFKGIIDKADRADSPTTSGDQLLQSDDQTSIDNFDANMVDLSITSHKPTLSPIQYIDPLCVYVNEATSLRYQFIYLYY